MTFRENLETNETLKKFITNQIECTWLLLSALQWFFIIIIILAIPISIIALSTSNTDINPTITVDSEPFISPGAKIFSSIAGLWACFFSFYYLLKLRKRTDLRLISKFWIILSYLSVIAICIISAELSERQYIQKNLYHSETTVLLYDSETHELLTNMISCSGGRITSKRIPSMESGIASSDEGFCIYRYDIQPAEMTFSAPGYQPQKVKIGVKEGNQRVPVYLEKETNKTPTD